MEAPVVRRAMPTNTLEAPAVRGAMPTLEPAVVQRPERHALAEARVSMPHVMKSRILAPPIPTAARVTVRPTG